MRRAAATCGLREFASGLRVGCEKEGLRACSLSALDEDSFGEDSFPPLECRSVSLAGEDKRTVGPSGGEALADDLP